MSKQAVVQDMTLLPKEEPQAVQPAQMDVLPMIERLASNPDFSVASLKELVELKKDMMRHNARGAFEAAYAKMQPEIPQIDERGSIKGSNGVVRSTYAKLEDIHEVIKPILAKFGFALRHRTEWPDKPNTIRVVGILSHEQGHSEESSFEAPMDKSDYRSDIQSMGSTVSYCRRYTTIDLLNISTRAIDDDGQRAGRNIGKDAAPDGFDDWAFDLSSAADEGQSAYDKAWKASKNEHRTFMVNQRRQEWSAIKSKAAKRP